MVWSCLREQKIGSWDSTFPLFLEIENDMTNVSSVEKMGHLYQPEEALMFIHFFTHAQSQFSLYRRRISLGGH